MNGIGVYCDCCGVCADTDCIKKANKRLQCKVITSKSEVFLHHWVKGIDRLNLFHTERITLHYIGNLPLGALCAICKDDCSMEPGLVDFQCCWCQRTVHTECLKGLEKVF